ncbi:MAG: hypothetical protein HN352_16000 [Bacteroidetes bacterium]|jgi:hypothetical protein|nr:hypothetical protein [Bacteroidota bacterium]MBT3751497.1 hypothetical protein [Bacteroidota bacterium]MBT4399203.1 hypothetical protein [Bacteroidota bacterium]MBT4412322.1 hypothetical protein [Bacteroidota bacterium]MBT5424686.1 hypothetical protein [Bacteroidota bacterium]
MRFLVCPQCGIDRFFLLNKSGDRINVKVNREFVIIPLDPDSSMNGFDQSILYCLGCSWKGPKEKLIKYMV